ncbi:hypothetical protein ABK040_009116 [Willaertia magna]
MSKLLTIYLLVSCFLISVILGESKLGVWEPITHYKGVAPLERVFHACELLPSGKQMLVYGGRTGWSSFSSTFHTYSFQDNSWTKLSVQPISQDGAELLTIPELAGHSLTRIRDKIYIFAGRCGVFNFCEDLYVFDIVSESLKKAITKGDKPSQRQGHSATPYGECMIVYGGRDSQGVKNDLYVLNTTSLEWKKLATTNEGPKIEGHRAVMVEETKMYILGGSGDEFNTGIQVLNLPKSCGDLMQDGLSLSWETLRTPGKARALHTANWVDDKIYVYGGTNSKEVLTDAKVFDVRIQSWLDDQKFDDEPTLPRLGHCSVVYDNKIYVFGGGMDWNFKRRYNDLLVLDTRPDLTKVAKDTERKEQEKKDLSELIDDALLMVRQLSNASELVSAQENDQAAKELLAAEHELRSLINVDSDDKFLSELIVRIRQWKHIEQLFLNFQASRSQVQNATDNIKINFDEIDNAKKDYTVILNRVHELSSVIGARVNDLKTLEENSVEAEKRAKRLNADQEKASSEVRALEKRIYENKASLEERKKQKDIVEKERDNLHQRLEQLNAILATYEDNQKDAKIKEEQKNNELERIRNEIAKLVEETQQYNDLIARLNRQIKDIDRKLSKLNDIMNEAESVKRIYLQQINIKKSYQNRKDDLFSKLDVLEEDEEKITYNKKESQQLEEDELKELEATIAARREKLVKSRSNAYVESQQALDELRRKNAKLKECKEEEERIQAESERLAERIAMKETEKVRSVEEKKKIEDSWKLKCAELDTLAADVKRIADLVDFLQMGLKQTRENYESLVKLYDEQSAELDKIKRELHQTKLDLRDKYEKMMQGINEAKRLASKIADLRRSVFVRKVDYTSQRADIVKFKEQLEEAVKEADRFFLERIQQLERLLSSTSTTTTTTTTSNTTPVVSETTTTATIAPTGAEDESF